MPRESNSLFIFYISQNGQSRVFRVFSLKKWRDIQNILGCHNSDAVKSIQFDSESIQSQTKKHSSMLSDSSSYLLAMNAIMCRAATTMIRLLSMSVYA